MRREFYTENIETINQTINKLVKQSTRNSFIRLFIMLGGGVLVFQLLKTNNIFFVLGSIIIIILLFAYFVFRQSKIERELQEARVYLSVNENEVNIEAGVENIYSNGAEFDSGKHPYTSDLDVFGPHSLFHLVNRCATNDGINVLASWMRKPSLRNEIIHRQEASSELSDDPKHMQVFQTKMLFNLGSTVNLKAYVQNYFNDKTDSIFNAFTKFYVRVAPYIFLVGVLASIFVYNLSAYLIVLAILHLLWAMSQGGKIAQFSSKIDKIGVSLIAFSDAIKLIEEKTYRSEFNRNLQSSLKINVNDKKLSGVIRELGQLIDRLDTRNNLLVGAILNMLFLWDFKQVIAINKWKQSYKETIISGFDVMSTYEALSSLAILRFNFPECVFPEIIESNTGVKLNCEEVVHPLINTKHIVSNSYSADEHNIALITGSNMAGKSTFLRTIGVNLVLAYSGGVVFANFFSTPIYHLVTYMRIKDSLNESTSTFKAELNRMKFILDYVKDDPSCFFLIDEMLRGTNSVDKYLGSKAIIKKLISLNGKGLIATHDLKLSELSTEFPRDLKNFHFDIQVKSNEMLFDYKLKDGPCTIFNASLLLKGIGVIVQNED